MAEIMVASTIGSFIALTSLAALRAITRSNAAIEDTLERTQEVRYATDLLRRDMLNLFRYGDNEDSVFIGTVTESDDAPTSSIVFYTVSRTKARANQPEGEVYEVEYYLQTREDGSKAMMRRKWPNPDEESEPAGILAVIAENVDAFTVRYFDGEEWAMEWPEEMETLPELVEVTLIGSVGQGGGLPIVESFMMNYAAEVGAGEDETGVPDMGGSSFE